jgi:hypothetical protein
VVPGFAGCGQWGPKQSPPLLDWSLVPPDGATEFVVGCCAATGLSVFAKTWHPPTMVNVAVIASTDADFEVVFIESRLSAQRHAY